MYVGGVRPIFLLAQFFQTTQGYTPLKADELGQGLLGGEKGPNAGRGATRRLKTLCASARIRSVCRCARCGCGLALPGLLLGLGVRV
jgi:hypothetical protein